MQNYTPFIARIFLSTIFIHSGIKKILDISGTQQAIESKGLPGFLAFPTILILICGGISVLIGYKARWGALFLIGFLIPATLIFHTAFPEETISFLKNLGLMGGLLMVYSFGSGSLSLDKNSNE